LGFKLCARFVRTIVEQGAGRDRITVKHLQRIDPDRAAMNAWKAKKQMRDRLPKRIHDLRAAGDALRKEVKGLR